MIQAPVPHNEPVLSYAPGSPERAALRAELDAYQAESLPLWIGGEAICTSQELPFSSPQAHARQLGSASLAGTAEVARAVEAAKQAKGPWAALSQADRAAVFLRAAELLAGPWRQRLNGATLLGQSKTPHQAEIDSACELIDFLRFNAHYADKLAEDQPSSSAGIWNRLEQRPLDGFVYAITPFNFTAIAGNLPSAPALMGNTVIWKPSPNAMLSAERVMQLFNEAGLPPGVINLVNGDPVAITSQLLDSPDFAGLHYTGSTGVFQSLWAQIANNLPKYKSYPRIVGETGGKDFIFAHPSADVRQLAVAIVRGGYEFQGQKCSAASRVYIPKSVWPELKKILEETIAQLQVGDPADFSNFMGAVISAQSFEKISKYQELGKSDPKVRCVAGGGGNREVGYFIEPTLFEVEDPKHRLMQEEIFGPVVTLFVYEDARYTEALELVDTTSGYALTGAVFARDRHAVVEMANKLRFAAGNFYINDKPTGAVVGQQPFGGSRLSGTNDKAGSAQNLARWVSPRTVKETLCPPTDWRYPYMG
ncbi:MAG: L-glutamate gamma-semialdehyde dehydrogenase [Polyangiaceae bacterium]|nr:L-glutamate gamma-semialdehyde dehydrogenase [Polyangiaceae bacterium]